jgi:hypothetical protein
VAKDDPDAATIERAVGRARSEVARSERKRASSHVALGSSEQLAQHV